MQQQASLASRQQLFSLVSFGRSMLTPLFSSNPAPLIGDVHIVLFYCSVSCSPLGSTTVNHLLQSWKEKGQTRPHPTYMDIWFVWSTYLRVGFITLDTFLTEASAYVQTRLIQHFIVVHPERNVTLEQRGGPINRHLYWQLIAWLKIEKHDFLCTGSGYFGNGRFDRWHFKVVVLWKWFTPLPRNQLKTLFHFTGQNISSWPVIDLNVRLSN